MRFPWLQVCKKFVSTWAAVFALVSSAHAFVPSLYSLSSVYQEADAIVVARCGATREVHPRTAESFDHKTSMTVVNRLVGPETFPLTFELATHHGASCDYDLKFDVDAKVLLFLKWSPDDEAYRAVGRSEGSFLLDAPLEAEFTKRIPALGKILALPKGRTRDMALTEFYVELCVNPITRRIGAHSLGLDTRNWMPLKSAATSAAQYQRMAEAIVAERPPLKASEPLVRLLLEYPDPALDAYLIESIRKWDQPGWSTLTRAAIDTLPKRLGVAMPPNLSADLAEHFRETQWEVTGPRSRLEEYYERMRPALMKRVLDIVDRKK